MDLFTLLRQHARTQPEALAISSSQRSVTWRKLWNRIERGTARLQQEWAVGSGDVVAYWGRAHPDAIVLYAAVARCGARLLPLEHAVFQSKLGLLAKEFRISILLHDEQEILMAEHDSLSVKPLSALIMDRCPHQPEAIMEDPAQPSLVLMQPTSLHQLHAKQYSLEQIALQAGEQHALTADDNLFSPEIFGPVVLSTLATGHTLYLR